MSTESHRSAHPIQEFVDRADRTPIVEPAETDLGSASPFRMTWSAIKEAGYVVSVVLALAGVYYGIKSDIQEGRRDIQELAGRVLVIERGRAENLPRLEEQIRNNAIQDTRIQNLTESLGRVIATVGDLARIVSAQGEMIHDADKREAVLEERLGRAVPRDR